MKTKNLFRATLLSLTAIGLLIFSISAINANPATPVKKHVRAKPQDGWYFRFYDSHGNEFIVKGFGGGTSGSVTAFDESCIDGTLSSMGTESGGTYAISSGVATLSGVVVDGNSFSGTAAEYSGLGDPLTITDCGGGGE